MAWWRTPQSRYRNREEKNGSDSRSQAVSGTVKTASHNESQFLLPFAVFACASFDGLS